MIENPGGDMSYQKNGKYIKVSAVYGLLNFDEYKPVIINTRSIAHVLRGHEGDMYVTTVDGHDFKISKQDELAVLNAVLLEI